MHKKKKSSKHVSVFILQIVNMCTEKQYTCILKFSYNRNRKYQFSPIENACNLRLQFFTPSPVNPILHEHSGTPCVTSQLASAWHLCFLPFPILGCFCFGNFRHVSVPEQSGLAYDDSSWNGHLGWLMFKLTWILIIQVLCNIRQIIAIL